MPHRRVCYAILLLWAVAAGHLFRRDVLPELFVGTPPDFRVVSQAGADDSPVRWAILVPDTQNGGHRSVGQVTTRTVRKRDRSVRLESQASFDARELLKGTPLDQPQGEQVAVVGSCDIDALGNLDSFRVAVRLGPAREEMLTIEGWMKRDAIEVTTRSPFLGPLLNRTQSFAYRPRGLVQTTLSPLDRMPGLQVGQTWESKVVSPLTGRVETCRVEVDRARHITWNNNPVKTLEVVTHMGPWSLRTWVRPDGLVLRQEVPFPLVKIILERQPEAEPAGRSASAAL